jgi:F0F1-type ATP synthase assembly protein I
MDKSISSGYWNQYREENKKKEDAVKNDVANAMEMALALIAGILAGTVVTLIAFTF